MFLRSACIAELNVNGLDAEADSVSSMAMWREPGFRAQPRRVGRPLKNERRVS